MLKHRLLESYPCSVVPGCPNRAKIFSHSLNNPVLSCQVHRKDLFGLRPMDSKLEIMFSSVDSVLDKYINIISEYLCKFLALHIDELTKFSDKKIVSDFAFMVSYFKHYTTEIRLFWFYEKLAHFQSPCVEEVIIVHKDLQISYNNFLLLLEFQKDFFLRIFRYSIFKDNKELISCLSILKLKITYKETGINRQNRLCLKFIKEIIGPNTNISLNNIELSNLSFWDKFSIEHYDRIMCHIFEPSVIDYMSPGSKKIWMRIRIQLEKTVNLRLRNFPKIDLVEGYLSTGIALHRIGELKWAIKSFIDAKYQLKLKKNFYQIAKEEYVGKLQSIYFHLGSVYFNTGVYFRAGKYFRKLRKINKEKHNSMVHFCSAYILIKLREFNKCLAHMKKNKNKIRTYDYWELKSNCYLGLANFAKASKFINKAIKYRNKEYIQYQYNSEYKFRRIRRFYLYAIVEFYNGKVYGAFNFFRSSHYIEGTYFHRNNILAAEYFLHRATISQEYGSYGEAVISIERALSVVQKNYTKNNFIYVEILVKAASIYLNSRNIVKAANILFNLFILRKKNRAMMKNYYEFDILIGQYLYLTNPIEEITHKVYKKFVKAREKIKKIHGYNHPALVPLIISIAKLYQLSEIDIVLRELKLAKSICDKFSPRLKFHPFVVRIFYEYTAWLFRIRKFRETRLKIKRYLDLMKDVKRDPARYFSTTDLLNIYQKLNFKEYQKKMKLLLSKIYIYAFFSDFIRKIIIN